MCGIGGAFAYAPGTASVSESELLSVREAMFSRGPDGAGIWVEPDARIGFCHRRLAILDLSPAGAQPMTNADGSLITVYNGEIYNYAELKDTLEGRGHVFRSTCDTEAILHGYAEWGEGVVSRLRGMFAFAIWDGRRRGLFLARDHFGIKPLYIHDDGRKLTFASQVKALLRSPSVSREPDAAGHAGFYVLGYVPEPNTLYRHIRALPSGSTLWVDERGSQSPVKYFSIPDLYREIAESDQVPVNKQMQILREALHSSVRHHLLSDVPVAVFLSAGIDSGVVAAVAAEHSLRPLGGITLGFAEFMGTNNDETVLAATTARQYQLRHHTAFIERADFEQELPRILAAMDQPTIDGINTYFVARAARQHNYKVCLSGLGSDEVFGGYSSFSVVPRVARLLKGAAQVPGLGTALRVASAPLFRRVTSPKYASAVEYGGSFGGAYLLRRALFTHWELPEVMPIEIARQGWAELNLIERLNETVRGLPPALAVSALELEWYMRNQLLRDADWAGMAHSVEIRVPFVDVPFLRAVAPFALTANRPMKQSLVNVPRNPLPAGVADRKKTGFSTPLEWYTRATVGTKRSRGLRGWSQFVMEEEFAKQPAAVGNPSGKIDNAIKSVLIYRLGSIGDTAVAIPALRTLANAFPEAKRILLTNIPVSGKAAPAEAVLESTGLIHEYISYPLRMRNIGEFRTLRRRLRELKPDTVVYLADPRGSVKTFRDLMFFRSCGIKNIVGYPNGQEKNHKIISGSYFESEAARLARCVEDFGETRLDSGTAWNLEVRPEERVDAYKAVFGKPAPAPGFFVFSTGTKRYFPNHWGLDNWQQLLPRLVQRTGLTAVMVGSSEEKEEGQLLSIAEPSLINACGRLKPRQAAALMEGAAFFVGHDSGPMHLAASVGLSCVAVFSCLNPRGIWFPHGENHRILYPNGPCEACRSGACQYMNRGCIRQISTSQVLQAVESLLRK